MKLLMIFILLFTNCFAYGKTTRAEQMRETNDWASFQEVVEQARAEDVTIGTSYLVSGALVMMGGIAGAQTAADDTSKFVFTLSQSLGIAGMGYGLAKLSFGNEYNSFYESLRDTSLTPAQHDHLVQVFMRKEKEKRDMVRRINIVTHLLLGVVNLYAASRETDPQAKSFMQFFGGANFALAAVYTF